MLYKMFQNPFKATSFGGFFISALSDFSKCDEKDERTKGFIFLLAA